MTKTARAGQALLVLLGAVCTVVAVSVWFAPDSEPFPREANVLISTFGAAMGILVFLLALGLRTAGTPQWAALWVLPAFFLSHILMLGTWIPDAAFLILSVAALLATRPAGFAKSVAPPAPATSTSANPARAEPSPRD